MEHVLAQHQGDKAAAWDEVYAWAKRAGVAARRDSERAIKKAGDRG